MPKFYQRVSLYRKWVIEMFSYYDNFIFAPPALILDYHLPIFVIFLRNVRNYYSSLIFTDTPLSASQYVSSIFPILTSILFGDLCIVIIILWSFIRSVVLMINSSELVLDLVSILFTSRKSLLFFSIDEFCDYVLYPLYDIYCSWQSVSFFFCCSCYTLSPMLGTLLFPLEFSAIST